MTWIELFRLLDREIEATESAIAGRVKSLPEEPDPATPAGIEHAQQQELTVESACEQFAKSQKWPHLDRSASWELYHRLLACREFARFVAQPELEHHTEVRGFPDHVLLRWVFVDYWRYAGIWRRLYGLGGATPKA